MKKIVFACSVKKELYRIAPLVKAFELAEPTITMVICYCGSQETHPQGPEGNSGFRLPVPNYHFTLPHETPDRQVSILISLFEEILDREKPDLLIVPGYYFLGFGYCMAASGRDIPVCNLDAGLQPFHPDRPMQDVRHPMDSMTSLFFISEEENKENLVRQGVDPETIFFAGNLLYQSLGYFSEILNNQPLPLPVVPGQFALGYFFSGWEDLCDEERKEILQSIRLTGERMSLIIPVFSNWGDKLSVLKQETGFGGVQFTRQFSYPEYLCLLRAACCVVTDSNTIQEEASFFGVPCLTMAPTTDRPVTLNNGTNILVGKDGTEIARLAANLNGFRADQSKPRSSYYTLDAASTMVPVISWFLQQVK